MHAYRSLRIEGGSIFWYLVAGALPGLILLASETLTAAGGASLAEVVHGFSAGDAPIEELSSAARVRDALIVLGAAVLVSLIGGLRTIREAKKEAAAQRETEETESV